MLRSKKGHSEISPKRISQAQKGNSSLAQSSGYRGNKTKAQRILKPRKRSIQKKKRTTAKCKKQGSSGTINKRGTLQAQRKRKTGTARWKEDRRRKQETKAKKNASDLSWHRPKRPQGTRTGKKNDNKRLSKWQNRIPPK